MTCVCVLSSKVPDGALVLGSDCSRICLNGPEAQDDGCGDEASCSEVELKLSYCGASVMCRLKAELDFA